MRKLILKRAAVVMISVAALALAGCWTTPNANVQPMGKSGLIQDGIIVESIEDPATVQAIDVGQRTIYLALPDGTTNNFRAGPNLKNFDRILAGQTVKATVTYQLAVYALDNGRLPDGSTAQTLGVNAKVLLVDPSYRLLTLQYPNGQSEIFKPGLDTKMQQMSPGDSVVVRPLEVTAIKVE
jgi:hypothetical protein